MHAIRRFIRRLLTIVALVILLVGLLHWNLISYGFRQARGQLSIIWNARPISEIMNDPKAPDSLKAQLGYIDEVRRFAVDSLGLKETDNYRKLFDQQGKPLMWVVTASEPFALKAREWDFPIVGTVPYKGFFDEEQAMKETRELERYGFDVRVMHPEAWSTLGWFDDPILSQMLKRDHGDLASLIIHELVHATLFVKDSVVFNENLASFIGERGAEKFLVHKYGKESDAYQRFTSSLADDDLYAEHILRGADRLDSLYGTFVDDHDQSMQAYLKQKVITEIASTIDTIGFRNGEIYRSLFRDKLPNNAYFLAYRRYRGKEDELQRQWTEVYHGDLLRFLAELKKKYAVDHREAEDGAGVL